MFPNLSSRAKAVTYAVLVLVLSFTVAFAMRSQGEAAAAVVMLTPTVAVVLMQLVVTRDGRTRDGWRILGLRHAGFRFWPIAIAMPVAVLAGAEAVVALTGLTGTDLSAFPNVPDLAIQLVIVGLFSLAEEIGWRGYLLPLVEQGWSGSRTLAAARVGFLHGLWHLPVALVVSGAYLTDGPRWLTVPLFLAVLTTAGVLYGWLRDQSGSVWPAAVTHTVFNVTVGIIFNVFPSDDMDTVVLVGRETGIATLGLLVLAAAFLTTRRTPAPLAAEPAPVVTAGR